MTTVRSAWWSITIPQTWRATKDKECMTIKGDPAAGVLQISAARKPGIVTDEDLLEFIETPGDQLQEVKHEYFSGFATEYVNNKLFWKQWWLKSGSLIVYVTYNVDETLRSTEEEQVEKIVRSLLPSLT